jgi:hypothetical protein
MTVQTSIYQYIRVHTCTDHVISVQKKLQTGLEPAISCILLAEVTPSLWDSDLNAGIKAEQECMSIYIITVTLLLCAPGGW